MGDPAGIGPDVILASWSARKQRALHPFVVYGDPEALRGRARALGLQVPVVNIKGSEEAGQVFADALPVCRPAATGSAHANSSEDAAIIAAIEAATAAVAGADALALVTGPIA
jgi:4-hydroxythreonine-4-phosphate dehydrogenase